MDFITVGTVWLTRLMSSHSQARLYQKWIANRLAI
jgi:hypothetical protein